MTRCAAGSTKAFLFSFFIGTLSKLDLIYVCIVFVLSKALRTFSDLQHEGHRTCASYPQVTFSAHQHFDETHQ